MTDKERANRICENCIHFRAYDPEEPAIVEQWWYSAYDGKCRRNPPISLNNNDQNRAVSSWPPVSKLSWCGEFKAEAPITPPQENRFEEIG